MNTEWNLNEQFKEKANAQTNDSFVFNGFMLVAVKIEINPKSTASEQYLKQKKQCYCYC